MFTNTEILCFMVGWQGGTLTELSLALCVPPELIQNANKEQMIQLIKKAQIYFCYHIGYQVDEKNF